MNLIIDFFVFLLFHLIIVNCSSLPKEIEDNLIMIYYLQFKEFFRFSQCFFCLPYTNTKKEGIITLYYSRYLCILNNVIYEFSNPLYYNTFKLSDNLTRCYYDILAIEELEELKYFIIFIGKNKHINFFQYSYIYKNNENKYIQSNEISHIKIQDPKTLSCQVYNKDEKLICFYIIETILYAEIFDIKNNLQSINKTSISINCDNDSNNYIKIISSISNDESKILVCFEQKNNKAYSIIYNKDTFFEPNFIPFNECELNDQLMVTYYYNEAFIFICQLNNNKERYKYFERKKNEADFTNQKEPNIQNNGFLIFDGLIWLYNKSFEECNLMPYSCFYNVPDDDEIPISYIPSSQYTIHPNPNISNELPNVSIKKDKLLSNITDILKDKEPGKTYKIKGDDYTIIIKPANSTREPNSTYINFTECESILRYHYNISDSSFVTLFQLELYNDNSQSLINQVEYQAYDQNFTKLNLKLCQDANIEIIYAIKDNILFDTEKFKSLKNLGIDVFNINDSVFWDVCQPFSDEKNDLILEDRIKDLYQNYSLCEDGCTYNDIDLENMTISCDCKIKENITTIISEINLDQIKYDTTSNFEIIKCYNIFFILKFNNIGFWIFTILIIFHFPLLFHYCYNGIKPVHNFVINEMIKFGYLKKNLKKMKK